MIDVNSEDPSKESSFVKHKMVVLDSNISNKNHYNLNGTINFNSSYSEVKSSKMGMKNGTLYKTTTIRNKFSSPSIEKVFSDNVNLVSGNFGISDDFSSENYVHNMMKKSVMSEKTEEGNQLEDDDKTPPPNEFNAQTTFTHWRENKNKNDLLNSQNMINFSKTSTTIYKVLGRRKKEFIDNLFKFSGGMSNSSNDLSDILLNQKKSFFKNNMMTYYMDLRKGDEIPHVFPVASSYSHNYNNFSEKNRYEKITEMFLKLKYFIENDEDNEKKYIKEFMMKHGIYEEEYYSIDRLDNFRSFLNSKMNINASKTVRDIIIEATKNNEEELKNKKIPISHFNSIKARHIINNNMKKNKTIHNKNKSSEFEENGEDKFNMSHYIVKNQSLLEEKKFKLDLNDPQSIIKGLEDEFLKLKNGVGGLTFLGNEYEHAASKRKTRSVIVSKNKYNKKNINERYSNSIDKSNKKSKKLSDVNKLPNVPKELDIDQIRKKNKLLEYIVLQRSKSRYQLQQDLKKFKITEV